MTTRTARRWLVYASLGLTAAAFVFFVVAPAAGYPLTFAQSIRLLEVVGPVFFGYVGSAVRFAFASAPDAPLREDAGELLPALVRGPILVFGLALVAALTSFGLSNRAAAAPGSGMDIDTLALIFSIALAFLAATTSVLVPLLFPGSRPDAR